MSDVSLSDIIELFEEADVDINANDLDPAGALLTQGLDSLDMMNVYFQIEEKFGITVDEESINTTEWDTLNNILASVIKYRK